jgi:tRNA (cytidine/uridine-2'-O-)-methyltransferase
MTIVLLEPEIPPNTGNIARLCSLTGVSLHLIGPLGFSLSDKQIKRSGMDYWERLDYRIWTDWEEWLESHRRERFFLFTTKAKASIYRASFQTGDYLVFGRESRGIPESILAQFPQACVTIPMPSPQGRSLNLSTAAGIGLYEAMRQSGLVGGD